MQSNPAKSSLWVLGQVIDKKLWRIGVGTDRCRRRGKLLGGLAGDHRQSSCLGLTASHGGVSGQQRQRRLVVVACCSCAREGNRRKETPGVLGAEERPGQAVQRAGNVKEAWPPELWLLRLSC